MVVRARRHGRATSASAAGSSGRAPPRRSSALDRASAALERRPPPSAMLVIVNPYATTMSDRLKHLVVYALQGRYDVAGGRHPAPRATRPSCAARPRARATTSSSRSAATARSTRPPTGSPAPRTPLTCLPGGATNVFCRMLGIPNDVVDATEHLLALADDWQPRRGRPRPRQRPPLHVRRRHGARRERRRARRPPPAPEGALRRRGTSPSRRSRRSCAATSCTRRGSRSRSAAGRVRGRQRVRPERRGRTRTSRAARSSWSTGAALDSGDLAGVMLTRASPVDVPTVTFRALSRRARIAEHRRVAGVRRRAARSPCARVDGRPVPVQVDGDHIGDEAEARFAVEPKALRVVC